MRGARTLEALPAEQLPAMWETVTDTTVRRALVAGGLIDEGRDG